MLITTGSRVKVTLHDDTTLEGELSMISFKNNKNLDVEIMLSENREDFENSQYGDMVLPLSCIKSVDLLKPCEKYKPPKLQKRRKPKAGNGKSEEK